MKTERAGVKTNFMQQPTVSQTVGRGLALHSRFISTATQKTGPAKKYLQGRNFSEWFSLLPNLFLNLPIDIISTITCTMAGAAQIRQSNRGAVPLCVGRIEVDATNLGYWSPVRTLNKKAEHKTAHQ